LSAAPLGDSFDGSFSVILVDSFWSVRVGVGRVMMGVRWRKSRGCSEIPHGLGDTSLGEVWFVLWIPKYIGCMEVYRDMHHNVQSRLTRCFYAWHPW
jgi:hypothetical protein